MSVYIICEAGQNHNGSLEKAKRLIDMAAQPIVDPLFNRTLPKANAVKFTKRDLSEEMSPEEYNKPYKSEHAYAPTYGEHRERLELSYGDHVELSRYAHSKGLDFVDTLCSPKTLQLLEMGCEIDKVKVASRDLKHTPLLEKIAKTNKPVIISTGMHGIEDIEQALCILEHNGARDITVLHCLSQYPADYLNLNLKSIPFMQSRLSEELVYCMPKIGFSDHSMGILMSPLAVALGARVIERHITLDRNSKGTDHKGSLDKHGLWRFIRDIRNTEIALGRYGKDAHPSSNAKLRKIGRSLAINKNALKGYVFGLGDFCMVSPGTGLTWNDRTLFLGKTLKTDLVKNQLLKEYMIKE